MTHLSTPFALAIAAMLLAATLASTGVCAQTAATATTDGVLSTSTTSTTTAKKKPTSATADMINEAIQRSEARAAKEAQSGTPQKWGSEEPFTYNPPVKRFDKTMQ